MILFSLTLLLKLIILRLIFTRPKSVSNFCSNDLFLKNFKLFNYLSFFLEALNVI